MDLKHYFEESKRSVSERNTGILMASGITAIIAAISMLFLSYTPGFYGALFLLAASGLAICAFAFAKQNFSYYIVPFGLGALASLAGFFRTLVLSGQFAYYGLHGHTLSILIGYVLFISAFITCILYTVNIIQQPVFPVILNSMSTLFSLFLGLTYFKGYLFLGIIFISIILLLLSTMEEDETDLTLTEDRKDEQEMGNIAKGYYTSTDELAEEKNVAICIILSIVTFGIYWIYWMYTICRKIRILADEYPGCAGELLCLVFVPFYNIYWTYTRAEKMSAAAKRKDVYIQDNRMLYMILTIIGLMLIAIALIQNDLNNVAAVTKGSFVTPRKSDKSQSEINRNFEIIKQLAELRDNGILSDEEFTEKKRKLLEEI